MNIRQPQRSNSQGASSQGISSDDHEQEIWRDKYFSTLDELENEQSTANAAIDVLRRGLLSVSLAGDGLDADLDEKLTELRGQLKTAQDYSSLSKLLQNIESDLIRLDTQKLENTRTQKTHTGEALSLLLTSSIDAEIKQELKVFQKKIKASEHNSDLARQFEGDLIELLLPLLAELSKDFADKNPSGGLWDRFRKSVSSSQKNSEVTLELRLEAGLEIESEIASNKVMNGGVKDDSSQGKSKIPLLEESKHFASKLLTSIYGHSALNQIAKALSKEISAADAATILASYPKVLKLLALSQTQDKKAFLDYLSEINSSLAKVSQSISKTEATRQKIKSHDKSQKQNLRGGIDKIRIILDTSTDLENLKIQTQTQLDDIVQSLDKSSTIIEQSEKELTDLATKQSAELASVADQAKNMVTSFELSPSSNVDPEVDQLTQLKNQGTLVKELVRELSVHKKRQQRLCLCIGDVQSLQLINDEYGRGAGDKALELLAKEIESKSEASDFLAYTENGRFVLLKPTTEFSAAGTEVDSLNNELAKLPFRFKGNEVKVNLTFAIQQSSLSDTATSLIEKTELALKKAKLSVDTPMPIDAALAEPPP
ncbi:MAG: diguanylate cyclase (GGDEF)-like protein [Pseudohongiellaceae bacterium]|jgi:diguanylate cyclase (GGDEF)-like protein